MSKKNKARAEFTHIDYWDKLSPEEQEYMQKFNDEYYNGNPGKGDDPILKSPQHIKEAYRMNNQLFKDAFSIIMNKKDREYSEDELSLIQLAEDKMGWEEAYKIAGPDIAIEVIFTQAERDIQAGQDIKVCLARAITKYESLKRALRKEKRK